MEILGRGGFGIVMRAFDESLHRMVAIKVLDPRLASTSPAHKRFLREARASAGSPTCQRRPDLCGRGAAAAVPGHGVHPGPNIPTAARSGRSAGPAGGAADGRQIAGGLAAAHEEGLIHRDIKPGNILLESGTEQNMKITDFGLARAADDASLTHSGHPGTPMYMSPEQAKGQRSTRRRPLQPRQRAVHDGSGRRRSGPTPLAVLKRVAEDTPRPIRQIIPECRNGSATDRQAPRQGPGPSRPKGGGSGRRARTTPGRPPAAIADGPAEHRENAAAAQAALGGDSGIVGHCARGLAGVIIYSLWRPDAHIPVVYRKTARVLAKVKRKSYLLRRPRSSRTSPARCAHWCSKGGLP